MFQIVLYYKRRTIIPPPKPSLDNMIDKNDPSAYAEYDNVLDNYNKALKKYKTILGEYEKIKDNSIVDSFVLVNDDEKFFEIVNDIENKKYFIEWISHSMDFIKNRLKKEMGTV